MPNNNAKIPRFLHRPNKETGEQEPISADYYYGADWLGGIKIPKGLGEALINIPFSDFGLPDLEKAYQQALAKDKNVSENNECGLAVYDFLSELKEQFYKAYKQWLDFLNNNPSSLELEMPDSFNVVEYQFRFPGLLVVEKIELMYARALNSRLAVGLREDSKSPYLPPEKQEALRESADMLNRKNSSDKESGEANLASSMKNLVCCSDPTDQKRDAVGITNGCIKYPTIAQKRKYENVRWILLKKENKRTGRASLEQSLKMWREKVLNGVGEDFYTRESLAKGLMTCKVGKDGNEILKPITKTHLNKLFSQIGAESEIINYNK